MADSDIATFKQESEKVLTFLHGEFAKLQTGRANASLLEHIEVEAYGQKQTLQSLAGITVEDAKSIVVQPWDKNSLGDIEKALTKADLGTSPVNDGSVIRINLPPMTEERREVLKKHVGKLAEEAKISIRHHRHEAQEAIRKETDEDVRDTELENLQKVLDDVNGEIDSSAKNKEQEVMTV